MALKSTNKVADATYELEFSVDAETFEAAVQKTYLKQRGKIAVRGFRKGKAPRTMIEKLYGEGVFYEDAVELVYPDAAKAAVEESGLDVIFTPYDASVVDMGKEGAIFKAKVAVKPTVELSEYKGLNGTMDYTKATEDEIEAEVKSMQERNSRLIAVEDRAAQDGDVADINFEGFVDGVAFDGGKGEDYPLELGSGQFIPGFEEQIVGHNVNDEFDVNVTFPEEYGAEELAGKEAVFKVKLNSLQSKELPELDDEFAKDLGFDTMDELKADIQKNKSEQKEKAAEGKLEDELLEELVKNLSGEIPALMTENAIDEEMQQFSYRMQSQGLDMNTYMQYTGMDMDKLRDSFRERAEKTVKIRLALDKVAEAENFDVADEEVEEEFKKMAEGYQMEVEKLKEVISADDVKGDIKFRKAVDCVKENANIKKKRAPRKKKAADAEAETEE